MAAITVKALAMFQAEAKDRQRQHGGTAPGKNTSRNTAGSDSGEAKSRHGVSMITHHTIATMATSMAMPRVMTKRLGWRRKARCRMLIFPLPFTATCNGTGWGYITQKPFSASGFWSRPLHSIWAACVGDAGGDAGLINPRCQGMVFTRTSWRSPLNVRTDFL